MPHRGPSFRCGRLPLLHFGACGQPRVLDPNPLRQAVQEAESNVKKLQQAQSSSAQRHSLSLNSAVMPQLRFELVLRMNRLTNDREWRRHVAVQAPLPAGVAQT